jgi:hypothetical protein
VNSKFLPFIFCRHHLVGAIRIAGGPPPAEGGIGPELPIIARAGTFRMHLNV